MDGFLDGCCSADSWRFNDFQWFLDGWTVFRAYA